MSSLSQLKFAGVATLLLVARSDTHPPATPPSLRQVATMGTARAVHTATTLPSGQVLLIGGMRDGGGSIAGAELFEPGGNVGHELGGLAEPRASHTATLLGNGRLVVAGGYNGAYLASVEVFDLGEQRFRPAGSLRAARSGHTATLMPDGRILFAGGVGHGWTFLRSAELYDPVTGHSEPVGPMAVPRESHTATLLADGRVLVVGGHSGRRPNVQLHASAEIFDPKTRRFETTTGLAVARHKHDAVRLADGRVLVIGGADHTDRVHFATTEIFRPDAGTFGPGPTMRHERYKIAGTSVLLSTGEVLVTSGARAAEMLDTTRWTFSEVPGRLPAAFRFAATALLPEDNVLITGGYADGVRNTAGVWRFRPH